MNKKYFTFDTDKNLKLLRERNISFEQIITLIDSGALLDVLEHPNQEKYRNQYIYVVDVSGYCYLVSFVENDNEIFLKTIIPSRKATKRYKD